MNIRTSFLRGATELGVGQAITQVCTFVRGVIVARLISPENFGIAAMFVMTYSMLEMMSHLAADVFLVQAPDGNDPRLQRSAQAVQASRGLTNAAVLFAIAIPIARLFGVPQAAWSLQVLAVVPLMRGFIHLDVNRVQREMRFGPTIAADITASVLSAVAALPIVLWRRDYSAMLWLLILQTAAYVFVTHFTATRAYAWAWDRVHARRILSFGWPLLLNGILMYGIFQGDRLVIGSAPRLFANNRYTLSDLGIYSAAFGLTMASAMFMVNLTTQLFLPILSRVQSERGRFNRRYAACCHIVCILSSLLVIPFMAVGSWMIQVVYGVKYAPAGAFIGWISAMFGIRLVRVAPTLAAIALGDTRNSMLSNLVRTIALAGVITTAAMNGRLCWIAASGCGGELAALLTCVWRLNRLHRVPLDSLVKPLGVSAVGISVGAVLAFVLRSSGVVFAAVAAIVVSAATAGIMIVTLPALSRDVKSFISKRNSSGPGEDAPCTAVTPNLSA
jgi:O-antigen/teichoic acid export membrane protein